MRRAGLVVYVTGLQATARQRLQDVLFEYVAASEVPSVHCAVSALADGVCGGFGTIRPAVPTDS